MSDQNPQQDAGERLNGFMELFLPQQRRLYQFIVSLLANTSDADDVFQETSLAIWNVFDQFQPGTDFYAWARQVAYNRILNRWRQQKRGVRYLDPDVLELVATQAGVSDDVAEIPLAALTDCIQKLNPADRHLIRRSYTDDASGRQLADELDRPLNSIYKSLGRIRRSLLDCIERTVAADRRQGGMR